MGHSTSESANAAVSQLLELPAPQRPTAIFAANNRCTIGAMHALHGGDSEVALVGFDEFELADLLGVTVVRTDPYRIGQVAAQLAFSRIDGDERPPQRVMLPVDLIARGSGEIERLSPRARPRASRAAEPSCTRSRDRRGDDRDADERQAERPGRAAVGAGADAVGDRDRPAHVREPVDEAPGPEAEPAAEQARDDDRDQQVEGQRAEAGPERARRRSRTAAPRRSAECCT